jgi:hypothetical protein
MNQKIGPTFLIRWVCSVLVSAPLLYWWSFRYKGDAVLLLILVMSLVGGLVLFVNSICSLRRSRTRTQLLVSLAFFLGSVIGVLAMPYVLPGWKM